MLVDVVIVSQKNANVPIIFLIRRLKSVKDTQLWRKKHIADFTYIESATGKIIVEDVKGYRTDVYKLKRKLFKWRYPEYEFLES